MTEASAEARSSRASAATVAGGLFLLGVSASVFLVLAARAVGPGDFAGLAVLWTLVYTLGIGLFLPFEQEVARALAQRNAEGYGGAPVLRRAAGMAGWLFLAASLVGLAASPWLLDWLGGRWSHVVALAVACAALAGQYIARGAFSGNHRYAPYSVQIGVEGLVRLLGVVALSVAGVSETWAYAALLAGAPLVSLLVTAGPLAQVSHMTGPPARFVELSTNLAWLLGASLAAQGLANLGTLAVTVLASPAEEGAAGHFLAGFTVARSPLFLFAAVQAVLLPGLTRHLTHGRHGAFRRQLQAVMLTIGLIGGAGILGSWLLGPEVLQLLFGPEFEMGRGDLVLLALSTAIYMVALVLQPAVIALERHRTNAVAWIAGLLVFGAGLFLPLSTFLRIEIALVLGALAVCVILAADLARGAKKREWLASRPDLATSRLGME